MKQETGKTATREALLLRRAQTSEELSRRGNMCFFGPAGLPAGSHEYTQEGFEEAQANERRKSELTEELKRIDAELGK